MKRDESTACEKCKHKFNHKTKRCGGCKENPKYKNNFEWDDELFRKRLQEAYDERDERNERIKNAFIEEGKGKVRWYSNTGRTIVMRKETYDSIMAKASSILREVNYQCHMHGETEPTPGLVIAKECYFFGYFDGNDDGMRKTLDKMGYLEVFEKQEEIREEKRHVRKMRRMVNKLSEPYHTEMPDWLFGISDRNPANMVEVE